jgi:hypothetical protein
LSIFPENVTTRHHPSTHTLPRGGHEYFHNQQQQTSSPSITTLSQRSQSSAASGGSIVQQNSSLIPLAIATLPRCNGHLAGLLSFSSNSSSTIGGSGGNVLKPNPPLRATSGSGTLRRGIRLDYSDNYNSDSNNDNDNELKV